VHNYDCASQKQLASELSLLTSRQLPASASGGGKFIIHPFIEHASDNHKIISATGGVHSCYISWLNTQC
jgi:hypothetical protein